MDKRPREFTYLNHKDNFPLELTGNMKRHTRPLSSIPLSNISNTMPITNDSKLATQVVRNYQNLKSVVPTGQLDQSKRRESVKVYNRQKYQNCAGVSYLMNKSHVGAQSHQKRHLTQKSFSEANRPSSSNHRERRHYQCFNKQNETEIKSEPIPVRNTTTLNKKLHYDLYSKIDDKECIKALTVKMSKRNMFEEGINLGYENRKQTKISEAKKKQIVGTTNEISRNISRAWKNFQISQFIKN